MGYAQTPRLQEFLASGIANPYATNWIPTELKLRGMNPVYASPVMRGSNWWNLSVWPVGESYFVPGLDLSTKELTRRARAGSNLFSFLKVEVTYSMNGLQPRCVVLDVGGGLDIAIPPSSMLEVRLLVPDPKSIPEAFPISFTDSEFATLVAITAECVPAPIGRRMGTYTQCYFVTDTVSTQTTAVDPIQRGAKNITVMSDGILTDGLNFGFRRPPLPDIGNVGDFPADSARPTITPSTAIPGTGNVAVFEPGIITPGGQTVCFVQELEL